MTLQDIINEGGGSNLIANQIYRALSKRKQNENVILCGRNGRTGIGVPYEAVALDIKGKTFLIEIKELA